MEKILVVDDEQKLAGMIQKFLHKEGYEVDTAFNGMEALDKVQIFDPDLIVLDLMLPGLSGEEVCQKIRHESELPVLMLTAKSKEEDKIEGFAYGADDYLVKPFSMGELIARIKAILRRSIHKKYKAQVLVYDQGRIKVYPEKMRVDLLEKDVELTKTEFDIFYTLLNNPEQVFSREQLAERVMGLDFTGFDRTIDAHIKNIRKKLSLSKGKLIKTIYGAGYKFEGE